MGPKSKKHTNKTTAETAISAGSISMDNVVACQRTETAASTNGERDSSGDATTLLGKKKKKNRTRGHHHNTSRATTKESHHHQNSRKRTLRQRQQSSSSTSAAVKNGNNIQDDDIEEQLKRQRQKQAQKAKLRDVDDPNKSTVNADTDDGTPVGGGGSAAAVDLPQNLGMYRYDAKRQAYFPASYSFSLGDADDDDDGDMSSRRHHHYHHPGETRSSSPVVTPRCRTFPHTPLFLDKKLAMASSSSSSSPCSFAYPVASCGNLSQRLGLVSTWAGRAVLESFGWTPSAAFLPSHGGSQACTWQFLHGCATMNSSTQMSSDHPFIVRPVDIDCKIGTVSWTRTFDIQWKGSSDSCPHNQPPRVVTVTDLDYIVQQHGKTQGRHLDFRRHCLGASVHSPRFLDTVHPNNAGSSSNSSSATTFSLLGTLDSAHGRSSLRLHKIFNNNDDDDDDNNHADVVFNFPSAQNDFVYCANDSLVFAPVMHHHHSANTIQQSHRQGNGNVNNNNNGYVPWLLCVEHGSFGAIRNEISNSESLFPQSEALCVEADPSNPNCFYFGHRNGQVTLFDINSGFGQSTQQESLPPSVMTTMTTTTRTNRSSLPFFGSITSIHPLSSSLSPRQVLVRGSQGSCRLYDFRKLGSSSSSSSSGRKGKRHAHNRGDPSLVYEMTPLPLLEDNKYYDDYACGNIDFNSDEDGGNSHVQRRHRRRQVQRLTNRCNGVVTNPEETIVISPHVQVQGADQEEMPTLGFWSLHTGDWIGAKPLAPSLTAGNDNEQFPATTNWSVCWVELSKRITPAWQWRKPQLDDNHKNDDDTEDNNERDRENDANLRPRPGSFGLWYKCGQSMAGPGLPPAAGSIHHVHATGNPYCP